MVACHVDNTWISEARRVKKILETDLDKFERIIDADSFKSYKHKLTTLKNPSWFSKKMVIEACVYVLSSMNIASGLEDLKWKHADLEAQGKPLSDEEKRKEQRETMTKEMVTWNSKVTKYSALLNPEYGNFLDACETLYNYVESEQRKQEGLSKKDKLGYISCGLDRARLFTGVTNLSPALRIQLLEAQVKPELRSEFYHPPLFNEMETKNWLHQWAVWEQISSLANSLLVKILEDIMPFVPVERVSRTKTETEPGSEKLVEDSIRRDFLVYEKKVRDKYFRGLWDKADVAVLRKRAKRLVYRFIVYQESLDNGYFWMYPSFLSSWSAMTQTATGTVYGEFSMYPAEGADPPRPLEKWEIVHCPWYLDSNKWSVPFNASEKMHLQNIGKGGNPFDLLSESKFQDVVLQTEHLVEVEKAFDTVVVAVDKSRKVRVSGKKDEARSDSKDTTSTAGRTSK